MSFAAQRASTTAELLEEVRDALQHLHDYARLERHPLALRLWPEPCLQGPRRAQRLHRLLVESVEKLNPPTGPGRSAAQAEHYMLLAYRFLEGRDIGDICHELGYSRRQFFREQRKALARLVALLADKVPQDLGQPVAGTDLLLVEVERVLAARESIHLQDAIDGILAAIGPLASQRRVRVRFVLDERLPPIYGNRTLLRQALLRTLSAMTTRPGVEEVLLSGHKSAGGVEISVVAKRDGKAALSESSSDEGVQTVRRFVQMMGGRWLATDTQSTADAYRFWLPTDQQQVLLVVEDNDAVVHAFRRYLASYGYQVVGVRNASEAIRLAKETSVVAIALDVMMPLQDGWEVLQELKRDQATGRIPVIVCSVLDDPDLAFSLGAAWYLHKPVSQADLVSALEAVTTANA